MTDRHDRDNPVELLLDDLFDRLAGTGHAGRRALAEAEDHLRTGVAEAMAAGAPADEAAHQVAARFGDPSRIATGLRVADGGLAVLVRPAFTGAWLLGAIGMIAIGASGLLSELLGRLISPHFVAGDPSGVTYTPQRCAEYLAFNPSAASCATAAELHHWGEIVQYRAAAGVLGLLALLAYGFARRVWPLRSAVWRPPAGLIALVATVVFGLAGVALAVPTALQWSFGDPSGVGGNLAAGVVALLVCAGAGVLGLRHRARTTMLAR